ncbi:MAG: flagellin, partial [Candidatus Riflebacteria bacterium]|nr:flagellin [Candidatus Riflebacteria bacterium]
GTVTGSGDTNFRLRVVNNSPQFHVGANAGQRMGISIGNMSTMALGVDKLDMNSVENAQAALGKIDDAINKVSSERSKIGSYENRLRHTVNSIQNTYTNVASAEARIRDADIAKEMIQFASSQIMLQSGTAMLAQANMLPKNVLSLLGG